MDKLDPDAFAEWPDEEDQISDRPNVQQNVTSRMICRYVVENGFLPRMSAWSFATYLSQAWHDYVDGEEITQAKLIDEALIFWRGGR
jgi:hypothetical protein